MSGPLKRPFPVKAAASVLFAMSSLFVFRIYGQVHWLPTRASKRGDDSFHRILSQTGSIRDELDLAYRLLALVALIWCIGSWRTEPRAAALAATPFAVVAVICAVFIAV
jgi:hypothetical protein